MRRDDAWLIDMLQAAREAAAFTDGLGFVEFEQNRMAQFAILKAIEIIGEAASQVGPEFKEAHPEIPWPEIIGMRNRLVHGYFNVNPEARMGDRPTGRSPTYLPTRTACATGVLV